MEEVADFLLYVTTTVFWTTVSSVTSVETQDTQVKQIIQNQVACIAPSS